MWMVPLWKDDVRRLGFFYALCRSETVNYDQRAEYGPQKVSPQLMMLLWITQLVTNLYFLTNSAKICYYQVTVPSSMANPGLFCSYFGNALTTGKVVQNMKFTSVSIISVPGVGFEVLAAVSVKMTVLRDVSLCSLGQKAPLQHR